MSESVKQNDVGTKNHLDALHAWMELQDTEAFMVLGAARQIDGFNVEHVKSLSKQLLQTPEEGKFTTVEVALAFQYALSFLCNQMIRKTDYLLELLHQKGGKVDA